MKETETVFEKLTLYSILMENLENSHTGNQEGAARITLRSSRSRL
jgi:hypothetical protein